MAQGRVLNVDDLVNPDILAAQISENWREWNMARKGKLDEWRELRNYLFATDTRSTSNNRLPWANSTTTPKLTQIRDNLHANYFASLFPTDDWMKWVGDDPSSNNPSKAKKIEGFMRTKLKQSGFVDTVERLIYDYIDYGNVFAKVDFEQDFVELESGEFVKKFVGAKLHRISPLDIVFNPIAPSFEESPKIIKVLTTVGDIQRMVREDPENEFLRSAVEEMFRVRATVSEMDSAIEKSEGFVADGFGSIQHYYQSGYVELLYFYGDIYDATNNTYKTNRIIVIADRSRILLDVPNPSWLGHSGIFHAGWRERPDNLLAMGPLDNLVGLQYRIDHLENMKADVWDQIAFPILKVRGDVEDFEFQPGERIYVGEEGDVEYLAPDATALNADLQIKVLEDKMEELAGAPRQAMGIRTPGEKTAFEVSQLQNAANRIFEHKTAHLERTFIEPILNVMFEVNRRKMTKNDVIRIYDPDTGTTIFDEISKEDVTANGSLYPMGARHFAERARRVQNLQQMWQVKLGDPTVGVHLSGKELARIMADELGEPTLYGENIAIYENGDTQRAAEDLAVSIEEDQLNAAEQGL